MKKNLPKWAVKFILEMEGNGSMAIKVGINGFGRIGRVALRSMVERGSSSYQICGINLRNADLDYMVYQVKYDSVFRTFRGMVEHDDRHLIINGKKIRVYSQSDAALIPWDDCEAEYIIESTGAYNSTEKASVHLLNGAKKVVLSAPAKDETTPTIVFGVNHETLKASDVIVSAGSCTTNSMAAMVKLLDENWGIKAGFMTTIHAYTGTQMILDGPRFPKARNNRAAAINTIPHSTGAAKAIGKVVPSVNGKLQGHAQRIQVPDGSVTELTTVLNTETTADEINAAFKAAFSDTDYYGYNDEGIVSSDILGDTHGGVFDPTQTDVNTIDGVTLARTVSFYDNEYGFTSNMIRTLLYFAEISE